MAQGTTKGVPIDVDPLLNLDSDLVVPSQKAIKAYVDAKQSQADSDYINVSGDTMTGYLLLHADPSTNLHAATKQYVDNYINGLDYKTAAHVGTVAALPAYSISVNKLVLTGTSNGAIPTATTDNHAPLAGERILVKNETSTLTPNNGIYVLTQVGNGSIPFILTRADDANTSAELGEATLSIINGDTLSNTIWHCTPASVPIVIGTTNLTFIQVGSGSVGTGVANELTYWASTSSLGSLATATYPNLTELSYVKGVTSSIQTQFSNKQDTITTLAVNKGGTGFSSYTIGDILYANTTTSLAKLAGVGLGSVLISGGVGAAPSWSNSPEVRSILLDNDTNGNILTLQSGVTTTSYSITLPTAAATGAQYLQSTGAGGTLQWTSGTTTGVSSIGTYVNGTGRTNGALISGSVLTFGAATASLPGMVDTGTQTFAGVKTFSTAGSITSAQLNIAGSTIQWMSFGQLNRSTPTFTNRSVGTKIVLYAGVDATNVDHAIGVGSGITWISAPSAGSHRTSIYGGESELASFRNSGIYAGMPGSATQGQLTIGTNTIGNFAYIDFGSLSAVRGAPTSTAASNFGKRICIYGNEHIIGVGPNETWITTNNLSSAEISFYGLGASNFEKIARIFATSSTNSVFDLTGAGVASQYRINNIKVVGPRITGWGTPGGTLTRATIAADAALATPTQAEFNALAQNVRALITDLRSHGLINN